MSHKGSRSRINNYEAAREAWERIWGKKDTSEPPRAITDTKAMSSSDPPKQNERADSTLASTTFPTTMKPGEANDKQ